jgi:Ni,Fe-hydrogenase III large subunit/NADH:ubiquinone oxidoreductase subunit C
MESRYYELKGNPGALELGAIPVHEYKDFMSAIDDLMNTDSVHCLSYFAIPETGQFRFICCMADDSDGRIIILSHEQPRETGLVLESMTSRHFPFHIFEREIHEEHGIGFAGHPWMKPVRYPFTRAEKIQVMDNYPFYRIEGEELHEVGVGPIHAGVIEPGYFRFTCNGENVLHLEIQLGYQHRGVEQLFVKEGPGLRKIILSENIAGDTVIGHSLCHIQLIESLAGIQVSKALETERVIALELERIAIHIGDTAALCADIAYQFGQAVNEALRTIIINSMQQWCGNRFGKGFIRTAGSHYPLTGSIAAMLLSNLKELEERYFPMTDEMFSSPSVLSRFESTGKLTLQQAELIGATGMAARSSGLKRDVRGSHPFQAYRGMNYAPPVFTEGDVWARTMLRKQETEESIRIIRELLADYDGRETAEKPQPDPILRPSSLAISMTEGWRGEIVHAAVTDERGKIIYYKVKDPSLHNWMALALAVRNQEISDFPLINKSFNLSYCGNDL